MFNKKFLLLIINTASLFLVSSLAFTSPGANIVYNETDLGGGLWQYDYSFHNTSSNNEYLYSVDLLFNQWATVNGLPLPTGWDSTVWEGTNYTNFIVSFSTNTGYDIAAGDLLSGFSFKIDHQAGSIPYNAYFDDHQGGISNTSGYTVTPEPVSSILFFTGGAIFIVRNYLRRKIQDIT